MATVFNDTTADHKWSTVANWSDGKPDAADAVTVAAGVTSIIIDAAATCLSFNATGTSGITVSGSANLIVYGSFTLDANCTWTHTGTIRLTNTSSTGITFNPAGKDLSSIGSLTFTAVVTLGSNLVLGGKALYIWKVAASNATLDTGNYTITCGTFGDAVSAVAITLTLGSSTINCSNVSFGTCTLTVSDNTATINVTSTVDITSHLGGVAWGTGGDTSFVYVMTGGKVLTLNGANTVGNFTISWTTNNFYSSWVLGADQVISGALTIEGSTTIVRPSIKSNSVTTPRHINAGSVSHTDSGDDSIAAVDFLDIHCTGATIGSSTKAIGNLGGNEGITFRTAASYYAVGLTAAKSFESDMWSITDDGTADGTGVFPLVQDTIIINNNTGNNTNQQLTLGSATIYHRIGNVDASACSEALTVRLGGPTVCGDLLLTGTGLTLTSTAGQINFDSRVKNEASDVIEVTFGSAITTLGGITIISNSGTTKILSAINIVGGVVLAKGTLDLNGQTLTCGTFSSSNSNTRTLQDTAGGGKIIINGLTGTVFDMATATNLIVSNAPDIDIGDGDNLLTGDITFAGGGKDFGDFKVTKHAGNFAVIIN